MSEPKIPGAWHPPLVWPPPMIREIERLATWIERSRTRILCHADDAARVEAMVVRSGSPGLFEVIVDPNGYVQPGRAIIFNPSPEPMPQVRPVPPVPSVTPALDTILSDIRTAAEQTLRHPPNWNRGW